MQINTPESFRESRSSARSRLSILNSLAHSKNCKADVRHLHHKHIHQPYELMLAKNEPNYGRDRYNANEFHWEFQGNSGERAKWRVDNEESFLDQRDHRLVGNTKSF